jgi:orotate phosphoribosyltransferase-like protein
MSMEIEKVLELYDQGKSTRDIAKELRMSLRDISTILKKNQASHAIVMTKDNCNINNNNIDNDNNKSQSNSYPGLQTIF